MKRRLSEPRRRFARNLLAIVPFVVEVGVDLFLADLFGDCLLIGHRLLIETDPLDRNGFLLNYGTLLVEDHLVLLHADVRP